MFHIVVATLPVVLAKAAVWNEALALGECASRHSKNETKVHPRSYILSVQDAFYTVFLHRINELFSE